MRQKILIGLLSILTIQAFSQDSKFSIELNYPIPIDKNFIGTNYSGFIDIGAKYRFAELNPLSIGASINGGYLKNTKASNNNPFDVNLYTIQPRVFAELNVESLSRFHPSIGLGYSFLIFNTSSIDNFNPDNPNSSSFSETQSGFNLNLCAAYDITDSFFAQIQFDFIKMGAEGEVPDISYNTNISILKIGIGYRF